jgi:hypothetical protein
VDDLVLDPPDARITLVVIAENRWFGLGSRFVVLPWHLMRPTADGTALTVVLAPEPPPHPPFKKAPAEPFPGIVGSERHDKRGGVACTSISF